MGESIPSRCAGQVHELEDSGTVIYDRDGRQLLVLNDIGAAVWYLIDGRRSVEDIVGVMMTSLDADEPRVIRDVETFLDELGRSGLVSWTPPNR